MIEALLATALTKAAKRTGNQLFDEAIDRYATENDLSEDDRTYIQDVVTLSVDVETCCTYYDYSGDEYPLDELKDEVEPLAKQAAKLEVIGDMRNYRDRDADALSRAAQVAAVCALELPHFHEITDSHISLRKDRSEFRSDITEERYPDEVEKKLLNLTEEIIESILKDTSD